MIMFGPSTLQERRRYYREEWSDKDVPDFIMEEIIKKEFGFDHNGTGPNDRYKTFRGPKSLRRFLRSKAPFAADVGVGPTKIDEVINVFKAYITRVGEGPFQTEIDQAKAEEMEIEEYGTVTGRRRRVGLFDFELAKESCRINGATQIALTCVDRLYPDCARTQSLSDLSAETKDFIQEIETETGVPVTIVSTGPDLVDTIDLRKELL